MITRTVTPDAIDLIASTLEAGDLVALPTETVYGLAARADERGAVERIFEVKGRPGDNPLIVHTATAGDAFELASRVPDYAYRLADAFWPGPMTLVLDSAREWPWVQAGHTTLGLRVPAPVFLRGLLSRVGPLAAPSANRSGRPSPTTAAHCVADLDGLVPLIVDGGPCPGGLESTVVDCTGPAPSVLRPGPITQEAIDAAVSNESGGAAGLSVSGAGAPDGGGAALPASHHGSAVRAVSPGTRYPHYRPRATVILTDDVSTVTCRDCMIVGRARDGLSASHLRAWHSMEELARELYAWFREADALGLTRVYVERVPETGLGAALMNRLEKAAAE